MGIIARIESNKFEVDILNNVTKIANLRSTVQNRPYMPLLSLNINGHNSVIFHPILTYFIFKLLAFSRRFEWCPNESFISFGLYFGVWPHFCSEVSNG